MAPDAVTEESHDMIGTASEIISGKCCDQRSYPVSAVIAYI